MPQLKAEEGKVRERRTEAERNRHGKDRAAAERTTFEVRRIRRASEPGQDAVQQRALTVREVESGIAETMTLQNGQLTQSLAAAASLYSQTVNDTAETLNAVMSRSMVTADGAQEISRTWLDWLTRTMEAGTRASQDILRCADIRELTEVQGKFLRERSVDWLDCNAEMLRISTRVASDAVKALGDRQRQAAEKPRRR